MINAEGAGATIRSTPEQQAHQRAEQHIRAAITAADPGAEIVLESATIDPCDDPTDGGPPGQVFAAQRYQIRNATLGVDDLIGRLDAFWQHYGYRVNRDERGARYPYLWVEYPQDGYRVGIDTNTVGERFLLASSPCFMPSA